MIERLRLRVGRARLRAMALLLALTGLLSLALNSLDAAAMPWVIPLQSALALSVPVGALVILLSALEPPARRRWLIVLLPVAGALLLSLVVEARLRMPLTGVALGWGLAGWFLFRPRQPRQVQLAIRALRRGRHAEALAAMDDLLKAENDVAAHYRLRAEIRRLAGDLDGASRDYRRMTRLTPAEANAWNGLAEVLMQSGRHQEAHDAARRARQLAPGDWVAGYNLGMIEDRLRLPELARKHLREALSARVPDARHRLLLRLYLARAQMRTGDRAGALETLQLLRRERKGLAEWNELLAHDQAEPLRKALAQDIRLAQALMEDDGALDALAL